MAPATALGCTLAETPSPVGPKARQRAGARVPRDAGEGWGGGAGGMGDA
jgi:hypothetical protein